MLKKTIVYEDPVSFLEDYDEHLQHNAFLLAWDGTVTRRTPVELNLELFPGRISLKLSGQVTTLLQGQVGVSIDEPKGEQKAILLQCAQYCRDLVGKMSQPGASALATASNPQSYRVESHTTPVTGSRVTQTSGHRPQSISISQPSPPKGSRFDSNSGRQTTSTSGSHPITSGNRFGPTSGSRFAATSGSHTSLPGSRQAPPPGSRQTPPPGSRQTPAPSSSRFAATSGTHTTSMSGNRLTAAPGGHASSQKNAGPSSWVSMGRYSSRSNVMPASQPQEDLLSTAQSTQSLAPPQPLSPEPHSQQHMPRAGAQASSSPAQPIQVPVNSVEEQSVSSISMGSESHADESGNLEQTPITAIFLSLQKRSASGYLEIHTPAKTMKMYFYQGGVMLTHPGSEDESTLLGEIFVREGKIKPEGKQALLDEAVAEGIPLGEHLIAKKVIKKRDLGLALRKQMQIRLGDFAKETEGSYQFWENRMPQTRNVGPPTPPLHLLFRYEKGRLEMELDDNTKGPNVEHGASYLYPTEATEEDLKAFGLSEEELLFFNELVIGRYRLREVFKTSTLRRNQTLILVHALANLNLLSFEEEQRSDWKVAAMRQKIEPLFHKIGRANPLDFMNLTASATQDELDDSYRRLRDQHNMENYPGDWPEEFYEMSKKILSHLKKMRNKAKSLLNNPGKSTKKGKAGDYSATFKVNAEHLGIVDEES